ncbi:putative LOC110439812 homolog isoform X1 [Xiphophorus couchianus]|uniref:putative LOC110439812 homolog isoform X1 n=1 Tax=Xiphophorus couchianus TaxID=32473 RepID=UPI001016B4ED|nr:kinesin-like protein KIN-14I isoform X1 [Xiphophorus couchianus]XP_027889157.1 kinesin-like protein KIN-14I isoform X1 [Xiphophorus couchianus]
MYMNTSGTSRRSYSLTFLGKKVGRHHSVAPAGKQIAWETTIRSTEEQEEPSQSGHAPVSEQDLENLPGSVPELKEQRTSPRFPNSQFQQYGNIASDTHRHKNPWRRRWAAFRRWIVADRRKRDGQGSSESQLGVGSDDREAERSQELKIYIPYESAELCIAQIAEDMKAMKKRHLQTVQELEENFQFTAQETQERIIQKVRSHYQNKLNTVRRFLDLYQDKVEKTKADLEKNVADLTAHNEQLLEEQRAERRRWKEETLQWQREKSKMLELFSSRLDALHCHQASTLQELQMARQEIGQVQEILVVSSSQAQQEAAEDEEGSDKKEQTETCSVSDQPLEGANPRLEELKESLYQKEREITELLEAERIPVPPVPQPHCSVLLPTVITKAHEICSAVPESRALLHQMIEDNRVALAEARDKLHLQTAKQDSNDKEKTPTQEGSDESSLSFLQETVREHEVCQIALDYIKSGECPVMNDCEMSELEDILGQETLPTAQRTVKGIGHQLLLLQDQLKREKEEKKKVVENYTSERAMRKKYYNMVEEMKGKIRVFCRIRPVNRSEATQGGAVVVAKLDDYSVTVETQRGPREFQFDKVFSTEASQEDLFQDVNRLMQSVIDGYNVCIFAYGQTGSGKTFTMVGDKDQKNPGIMPRSFNGIFDIMRENGSKFDFKVSAYMLELYNDSLQDLFVSQAGEVHAQTQPHGPTRRVEIKRNRKGVVFAQGAETKEASSAQELYALFQQACANRHISATKMNVESSRSHLIVGIMVESRNLTNGSVNTGKLSLVDLAGSERAAKTGAKDHQLKEANSINKSLSALGDVISALSAELPHVPYRNSKLTQVMQDSLGGNAKTLMIVNISPSEYNLDETLTSLVYATRVKAITNNAQRNVDSKEIAQLKEVIMKLKSGQAVEEVDV